MFRATGSYPVGCGLESHCFHQSFTRLSKLGREPSEVKSVEKLTAGDLRKMIVKPVSMKQKKSSDEIKISTLKPMVL